MRELLFFLKQFKCYYKGMFFGFVFAFVTVAASVALLSLAGWFIAATAFAGLTAIAAMNFNFFLPAGGVRLFAMIRIGGRYVERLINHNVTFKILSSLRLWVYDKLEPLAPAYLLKQRSAELLNRMVSDVDALDNLFLRLLSPVAIAILVTILLGFFISLYSHAVAVFIVVMLLSTVILLPLLAKFLARRYGDQLVTERANLRQHSVDLVQGLPELLIFNQHQKQLSQIAGASHKFIGTQAGMAKVEGLTQALYTLLLGAALLGATLLTIHMVELKKIDGAIIALVALAVMGAFEAILPLPRAFQYLSETQAAAKRLFSLQQEMPAVTYPDESAATPKTAGITMTNLQFGYRDHPVLDNFNLQLKAGEKVGVVGASGAGKSTLLHLINRDIEPEAGSIQIGDVDITGLSELDLRSQVSFISQHVHIFNGTLRENLLIAKPNASDLEIFDALEQVQLSDFVAQLTDGLDAWLGEAGAKVSGGQARRIALARALLHDAPIWLLDEPTEGLDLKTEQALLQDLSGFIKDKTVLMVSHRKAPLSITQRIISIG